MRINSSTIGMESARSYAKTTQKTLAYSLKSKRQPGSLRTGLGNTYEKQEESFKELLSANEEASKSASAKYQVQASSSKTIRSVTDVQEKKSIEAIKEQCIQYLIFLLFSGRKDGQKQSFSQWQEQNASQQLEVSGINSVSENFTTNTLQVNASVYEKEKETTDFSTEGTVITADGRQIQFQLDMTMSRSFEKYYEANYTKEIVAAIDPLVINLDGNVAAVSDQKFEFDIDSDGILDSISRLEKGSGYIALDKNGDGIINDGNELFGTKSGDGFQDLSQYDSDGNGWIDEADEIWDKLLIWSQDENGKDQLYNLSEAGVGAICLKQVSTDFSLNSLKDNKANAQIRKTGIFLYENGNVGTMQQLDLVR